MPKEETAQDEESEAIITEQENVELEAKRKKAIEEAV
jgi:hypothetical protein